MDHQKLPKVIKFKEFESGMDIRNLRFGWFVGVLGFLQMNRLSGLCQMGLLLIRRSASCARPEEKDNVIHGKICCPMWAIDCEELAEPQKSTPKAMSCVE